MKYRVADNGFNRAVYSRLIGQVFDAPPGYAAVEKIYTVRCHRARKLGAIGIFYSITEEIVAADEKEAKKKFFDTHEVYFGMSTILVS